MKQNTVVVSSVYLSIAYQCIFILQCWEQPALRHKATTAPKRSWTHMDYFPFCDTVPCSTATQPLSALVKTCSLTGKLCSWGKVMELGNLLRGLLLTPHFTLPVTSATPEHRSMHPSTELLGREYIPVLKNTKGRLKLQDNSAMSNA